MKISLNWVRQFTEVELAIDDLVARIGAQLGAVEEVIDLGARYQNIVVARVITCEDHPNADRLHVCTIDDGGVVSGVERNEHGHVQVVCGAPNVREGLLVAWLPPGSTVPSSFDKDPFVLEARELRGVISNGMLASAKELAIADDHNGILEVDIEVEPGTMLAEVYELNDFIIDVENKMFTHRPDCFGMLGVAREIAGIQHVQFTSPEWYKTQLGRIKPSAPTLSLVVRNELPELVPRFCAIAIADVTIAPSPVIMQTYLSRVGIRPINNVVDITNYLMVLTGQPLHAYDYDKVRALDSGADTATIVIRKPVAGETLTLLNGKTITPREGAVMIASATHAIGLGGVMGGSETEVDNQTKNIILEVANFDMYSIRRTSMAHGLFTDAVTRFNKGQSPLQNDRIIEEATVMVTVYTKGHVASDLIDVLRDVHEPESVKTTAKFINERLGLFLPGDVIRHLLDAVEFTTNAENETLIFTPPFWRTDIGIPEDIVEEVGRLYGYDQLPLDLPKRSITPPAQNKLVDLKQSLRELLARFGANEVVTYSFVHGNTLRKAGQDPKQAYQISNALSPDLQYYRLTLLPSLLERVHPNHKAGYDSFALFEFGKTHRVGELTISDDPREDGLPVEFERLAFVFSTDKKTAPRYPGAAYYQAKYYLVSLLDQLGIAYRLVMCVHSEELSGVPYYEQARSVRVVTLDGDTLGFMGELKESVRQAYKLPDIIAGFEIDTEALLRHTRRESSYVALPRFPKITQDICLKVAVETTYNSLYELVEAVIAEHKPTNSHFALQPVDIYQLDEDSNSKQITLRLIIASYERTLTDSEIVDLLDIVAKAAYERFDAERV